MAHRHRLSRRASRKNFRRGTRVHGRNASAPMRGGIRLQLAFVACFHPWEGYWKIGGGMTSSRHNAYLDRPPIILPCGKCIGCKVAKSADWTTRLMHEFKMHDDACFLTLTYNDENLPPDGGLCMRDLQLFMKRLRKEVGKVRFFACGEYGSKTLRPHYHVLVFGHDFSPKYPLSLSKLGYQRWRSPLLEKLWTGGFSELGSVTKESVGYVARYTFKKIGGAAAADHYLRPHPITGELHQVKPEFITMSRRPGIGALWLEKFQTDAFPSDFVILEGQKRPVPAYYMRKLRETDYALWCMLKGERLRDSHTRPEDETPERMAVREEVLALKLKSLRRTLD